MQQLFANPKKVFLLDGIGAIVSALFLGVVLVQLEPYIGMPKSILHVLASMALLYAVYSMSCYFFLKSNWSPFLKIIAFANSFHCLVTIYLIFTNYKTLTPLGITYFVVEILIVIAVVLLELNTAKYVSSEPIK